MSLMPQVPPDLQGKTREYLIQLVRRADKELRLRPARQVDGVMYMGFDQPYIFVDEDGNQFVLGQDVLPPGFSSTPGASNIDLDGIEGTQLQMFTTDDSTTNPPLGPNAQYGTVIQVARVSNRRVQLHLNDNASGDVAEIRARAEGSGGWGAWRRVVFHAEPGEGSWTAPTLQNGWKNYVDDFPSTDHAVAGFRKTADGMVVVKGLIRDGTTATGTPMFTLPVGYRPAEELIIATLSNAVEGRIDVHPNGEVATGAPIDSNWVAINFSFYADQ